MAGTKLDRAWSDFLDSRRIYCIKLFTVGQRIAGRSNLPCGARRERERGGWGEVKRIVDIYSIQIHARTYAHTRIHLHTNIERARRETRRGVERRDIGGETETRTVPKVRAALRFSSALRNLVSGNCVISHLMCRMPTTREYLDRRYF